MTKKDEPTIVIGVPGTWKNKDAILAALVEQDYIFAGIVLMHTKTNESFGLEIYEKDPAMRKSFEVAGLGQLDETLLDAIEQHTFTLYLIGSAGSLEAAQKIMQAANALLDAGGLAVKVETTGKAFSPKAWKELCAPNTPQALYIAFVLTLRAQGDVFYTCGMHNLGLKDSIVGAVSEQLAAYTLDVFSLYQLLEQPDLQAGETFQANQEAPVFRLMSQEDSRYAPDDSFHNRYGLWILAPVE